MIRIDGRSILLILSASILLALFVLCGGCSKSGVQESVLNNPTHQTSAPNKSPVSVPDAVPRAGAAPLEVRFFDGGSYDEDGYIVKWEWNFDDKGSEWEDHTATQGEAVHIYEKYGTRSPKLRVTDNGGKKDMASILIDVKEWNNADPIAVANADPTSGSLPLAVDFNPIGSYDPDGTIVRWEWDFGDGLGFQDFTSEEGITWHMYVSAGHYRATLLVTDNDGGQSTASIGIVAGHIWRMFGLNVHRTRRTDFVGPISSNVKWAYNTGSSHIPSSPAIGFDGIIYVGTVYNDSVLALNPDGTLRWEKYLGNKFSSSPAIGADGTIYIGDRGGKFFALSPSGSILWTFLTGDENNSSPLVSEDGTIYFGSKDSVFYALNPDGSLKWQFTTGDAVQQPPSLGLDGNVYIGSLDGNFYALDPDDGSLVWSFAGSGPFGNFMASAVNSKGIIHCCTLDGKLYALDPNDGHEIWSYQSGGTSQQYFQSPAIGVDDSVYISCLDGYVHALTSDGNLMWKTYIGPSRSSVAIDGAGKLYVAVHGSTGGYGKWFYCLDPEGTILWSYLMAAPYVQWSSPAIGEDGTVYIGSGPRVYAFGPGG